MKTMRAFLNCCAHLIVPVAIILFPPPLQGQTDEPDDVAIVDGRFTQVGETVYISYRLVAPEDEEVDISVVLRKGEDSVFAIVPVSATGAIGKVRGEGDKLILWNYRNDVPPGFEFGTDYWFEFQALVEEGLTLQWWHYAVGGGVIAAVVVLTGSTDDQGTTPYVLPDPPGTRPPDK
jgi:hypothetical protein